MGQVLIEIPQNVRRIFQVKSFEYGEQLLKELEQNSDTAKPQSVVPPRRDTLSEDSDAVLGIWADRDKSAEEIAHEIREKNRRVK